jgi:hypothetical protein
MVMEYLELKVIDKIRLVNKKLSMGATLTEIVKELKTSKGTIKKIFEVEGFYYNSRERLYLLEGGDAEIPEDPIVTLTELQYINKRLDTLEWEIVGLKGNAMAPNLASKEINILDDQLVGDLKVKSFKVYGAVLNRFIDFSTTCKSIKKQDLVSQALLEFIINHE